MNNNKQRLFEMMEKINQDFRNSKPIFLILVGISGSGKSTWINSIKGQGFTVVSFDDIRREVNNDVTDHSGHRNIINIGLERIADALNAGKNVILDATNVKSKDRKGTLDYLKSVVSRDFIAQAKIFQADPEISKERVAKDIEAGVDRSNVPPEAIDRQYKSFTADLDKIESDGYTLI